MKDEYIKFNGWYAVVDDCDNVLFESQNFDDALNFYSDSDSDDVWITKEMDLYNTWGVELGFISFHPVAISY